MKISNAAKKGFARAFDLGVNCRNWPNLSSPKSKDYNSLRGDLNKIGNDFGNAEQRIQRELAGKIG